MKIRCTACQTIYEISMDVPLGQRFKCTCGTKFPYNEESAVVEGEDVPPVSFTLCTGCGARLDTEHLLPGQSFVCPLCKHKNRVGQDLPDPEDPETSTDETAPKAVGLAKADDLAEGTQIGHCRIARKLGVGAMGAVYLAHHTTLDIPVVIKVLLPSFVNRPEFKDRFYREAHTTAQLNHPNIVRVLDCGEEGDLLYLVMEYVDGGNLKDLLAREGRLRPELVIQIARSVCRGLVAAARHEIIHRDVKPDNIMYTSDGVFKLADLGLAKKVTKAPQDATLTVSPTSMGTPHYMSPEQAVDARTCDARSDIYALGATMYHLLCGGPPFDAPTSDEVLRMHITGHCEPPSVLNPDVPSQLDKVIGRAMMKRPEYRYQSAARMLQALDELSDETAGSNTVEGGTGRSGRAFLIWSTVLLAILSILLTIYHVFLRPG